MHLFACDLWIPEVCEYLSNFATVRVLPEEEAGRPAAGCAWSPVELSWQETSSWPVTDSESSSWARGPQSFISCYPTCSLGSYLCPGHALSGWVRRRRAERSLHTAAHVSRDAAQFTGQQHVLLPRCLQSGGLDLRYVSPSSTAPSSSLCCVAGSEQNDCWTSLSPPSGWRLTRSWNQNSDWCSSS